MNWCKDLIILCTFCLLQMAGSAHAQNFTGFRDGHSVYSDRTLRRIKLYLEVVPTITLPSNERIWTIKLGDIYIKKNSNEKN